MNRIRGLANGFDLKRIQRSPSSKPNTAEISESLAFTQASATVTPWETCAAAAVRSAGSALSELEQKGHEETPGG